MFRIDGYTLYTYVHTYNCCNIRSLTYLCATFTAVLDYTSLLDKTKCIAAATQLPIKLIATALPLVPPIYYMHSKSFIIKSVHSNGPSISIYTVSISRRIDYGYYLLRHT